LVGVTKRPVKESQLSVEHPRSMTHRYLGFVARTSWKIKFPPKVHRLLSYLVFAAFLGCSFPERPKVVTISNAAVFKPSGPKEIHTLEEVMAAIITVCRDDLGLPVVDPLKLFLYRNNVSVAIYGFGWPTMPTDIRHIAAFAKKNELHVNLDTANGIPWGYWLELLAHEYGHNIHYEGTKDFHGDLQDSPRWVVEGFGHWVAARILHALRWQEYDVSVHCVLSGVLRHREKLPPLSSLNDAQGWEALANRPYALIRTYQLAFVAVHQMLESKPTADAVKHLVTGKYGAIASQAKLDAYLAQLSRSNDTKFSIPKPEWKIGDQWRFKMKIPGRIDAVEREILSESNFDGRPSFVVRVGNDKNIYAKNDLGLLATFNNDKLVSRRNKPTQVFSWPLESGKEWRNAYTFENVEKHIAARVDRIMTIAKLEQITVLAGAFNT